MANQQLKIPVLQYDFDTMRAKLEKEKAVARVAKNADREWVVAARQAVEAVAKQFEEFTTDEVLEVLRLQPVATHEGRALGPVMIYAARQGWVKNTERVRKSSAVSRHNAPKTVWRSLIFDAAGK